MPEIATHFVNWLPGADLLKYALNELIALSFSRGFVVALQWLRLFEGLSETFIGVVRNLDDTMNEIKVSIDVVLHAREEGGPCLLTVAKGTSLQLVLASLKELLPVMTTGSLGKHVFVRKALLGRMFAGF